MRDFTFTCSIVGQDYSLGLLATVRYHRGIHVLHELKRAGANVAQNKAKLKLSRPCLNHQVS